MTVSSHSTTDNLMAALRWLLLSGWRLYTDPPWPNALPVELAEPGCYGDWLPICRFEIPVEHREAVDVLVPFRVFDYFTPAGPHRWEIGGYPIRQVAPTISISGSSRQ